MVALCRLGFFSPQLDGSVLPIPPKPGSTLSSFPSYLHVSTTLSLMHHQKPLKIVNCSFSSPPSMEAPPEGYRRNVGICLINSSNKIFSALKLHIPGAWQMPQGGIDEGEDPITAAIRELREETGVSSVEVLAEVPFWMTYDFPPGIRVRLNKQWGDDWKGQAQKWFLLRFTGKEDEINLLGDGTEKPEFVKWTWMTPQQILNVAVAFKKPVYEEALKVFTPHLSSNLAEPCSVRNTHPRKAKRRRRRRALYVRLVRKKPKTSSPVKPNVSALN